MISPVDADTAPPSVSQCGGTTHVLRLSWSPDGQYLVSAHAMNNSGPTAQIVERDGWKTNMDFVGHRKAVTVVVSPLQESERRLRLLILLLHLWFWFVSLQKFNPKIFKKKQKNGSNPKPSCPYCCCAVGSKDRSLSVWVSSHFTWLFGRKLAAAASSVQLIPHSPFVSAQWTSCREKINSGNVRTSW